MLPHTFPSGVLGVRQGSSEGFMMLDYHERPLHNTWTMQQQMFLCCIRRFFEVTREEEAKLFNYVFADDVRQCGFENGLPVSTINTQWADLQRRRRDIWVLVHEKPFAEAKSFFRAVIRDINIAANCVGIAVFERQFDDLKITRTPSDKFSSRKRILESISPIHMQPLIAGLNTNSRQEPSQSSTEDNMQIPSTAYTVSCFLPDHEIINS